MEHVDLEIRLGDGDRVEARWDGQVVATDQDGSAPAPLHLFFASIGTCVGFYVSRFCRRREISTAGLRIRQRVIVEPATGLAGRIEIAIDLPAGFPEAYRDAVLRAAQLCAVKKHLEHPPAIEVAIHAPVTIAAG